MKAEQTEGYLFVTLIANLCILYQQISHCTYHCRNDGLKLDGEKRYI